VDSIEGIVSIVQEDLVKLRAGDVKPTTGDMKCITYGHLIRLAIWNLRKEWDKSADIETRLSTISSWITCFGGWTEVERHLLENGDSFRDTQLFAVRENREDYGTDYEEISF
jgi:hypothetical protein